VIELIREKRDRGVGILGIFHDVQVRHTVGDRSSMSRPSRPAPERRRDGRFAIYAAPGTGSTDAAGVRLREQAESWLGRRMDGTRPDPGLPSGWTRAAVDEITVDARRYGFHGTLKAPFRLAEGRSIEQLEQDLERFAETSCPVALPRLSLRRIGGFFALVPGADAPDLHELAAALVTGFDAYRAPARWRRPPAATRTR